MKVFTGGNKKDWYNAQREVIERLGLNINIESEYKFARRLLLGQLDNPGVLVVYNEEST